MMNSLWISLVQSDIFWEDKEKNLHHYGRLIESVSGKSDLVVLPEMFSTGFSMNAGHLSETNEGLTMQAVRSWAERFQLAVCGSFLACNEKMQLFNRGFFITPDGSSWFYDKRHLFRMGDENLLFSAGNEQLIIPYKGWNIRLIICYDLRFPVWSRNVDKAYDLLICPANWPQVRRKVWDVLLKARALENYCYVCGVNRIGEDGHRIYYQGGSMLIDFKGDAICGCEDDNESVVTGIITKELLDDFRCKFPVWMDADSFEIK